MTADSPKRVLLADDELHVTHILRFKLEQAGIQVLIASDGQEAFDLACEHRPDLLISDLHMPELTGLELCQKLRSQAATADIPVIMLTAREHCLTPAEMAQTNIRLVIAKPFSARELLNRATELLEQAAVR